MRKLFRNKVLRINIMSTNKSVLAAQRRRSGQEMQANAPIRTPQPSINSAQMFNGQGRQMPMPGQRQPAQQQQQQMYQQQQHQQMYQQQQQQQQQQELANSKLTVAQAITLITLRLGSLESKMMEIPSSGITSELGDNIVAVDKGFMDSIMERLESLEKYAQVQSQTPVQSSSTVNQSIITDVTVLKQQFEPIKQATVQTKNAVVSLTKEAKDTKSSVDSIRQELNETKDLLHSLQTMVIDNNSKLLNLSLSGDFVSMSIGNIDESMQYLGELELDHDVELEGELESELDNEIVGTNLKELIENEINLDN